MVVAVTKIDKILDIDVKKTRKKNKEIDTLRFRVQKLIVLLIRGKKWVQLHEEDGCFRHIFISKWSNVIRIMRCTFIV